LALRGYGDVCGRSDQALEVKPSRRQTTHQLGNDATLATRAIFNANVKGEEGFV
jgi:hypothetical protein